MASRVQIGINADQGSKWTARQLLRNPFDRFELDANVAGWIYRYVNEAPLPIPELVTYRIEVAVQLAGEWWIEAHGCSVRSVGQNDVFLLRDGLRHRYAFRASAPTPGVQVGFSLDPEKLGAPLVSPTVPLTREAERRWRELAQATLRWREGGQGSAITIADEVRALVLDRCDIGRESPVARAVREMRASLDRPLYLGHLAEVAGLHEKTLSRRFLTETGCPPIRYRTHLRLQRAVHLLWSRPELSVVDIAREVGFDDPRFFHRLVRRTFQLTPAELGRR